jgi:hypothetical protein
MIIFITDKQLRKNLKAFGFQTVDSAGVDIFNKMLFTFVQNKVRKAVQKGGDDKHIQTGGRVLLPSEYFGVESNHYVSADNLSSNGVDMTVKDEWIRPPMDLMRPLEGGAATFEVSMNVIKTACNEVLSKMNGKYKDAHITNKTFKLLQNKYSTQMSQFMRSLRRKVNGQHIKKSDIEQVLSMKKYSHFA